MKYFNSILITLFIFWANLSLSQTAGGVYSGLNKFDPNFEMSVHNIMNESIDSLDFDCDGNSDFKFELKYGNPMIDGSNYLLIQIIDSTSLELCADTSFPNSVRFFFDGEVLQSDSIYEWLNQNSYGESSFGTSVYGGWGSYGNPSQDSVYFSFKKNGVIHWMNISYHLAEQHTDSIFFVVNEVLSPCIANSNFEFENSKPFSLYPNPAKDFVNLSYSLQNSNKNRVFVYNSIGQMVKYIDLQSGKNQTANLDLHDLSAGLYYYHLEINGKIQQGQKLIISD